MITFVEPSALIAGRGWGASRRSIVAAPAAAIRPYVLVFVIMPLKPAGIIPSGRSRRKLFSGNGTLYIVLCGFDMGYGL